MDYMKFLLYYKLYNTNYIICFFIFLFCFDTFIAEENKNENDSFPKFLIQENEYLSTFPKTNYIFELSNSDFIVCKKNPKFYNVSREIKKDFIMEFNNKTFTDIGEFNNDLIDYFLKTNDLNTVIEQFKKLYSYDSLFFATLYNIGKLNYLKKDYNQCVFYFNKTLYFFDTYARIHYYLGKCYFKLNDEIKGEYHFRKAIQLHSDQIEYWIDFIKILQEKKQFSKANLYFQYGEKKFHQNTFFKIFKAQNHIYKNEYSQALKLINEVSLNELQLYEQLELKYTKSILYEKTSKIEDALKEILDILESNDPYFFNKYSKEMLKNQKERLEKILKK